MAIKYEPKLLRQILLQVPEMPAQAAPEDEDERETAEEATAELAAAWRALRQSRREDPAK